MKFLLILCLVILAVSILTSACMSLPTFGSQPKGDRLQRMRSSPNYRNGMFVNRETTVNFVTRAEKDSIKRIYHDYIAKVDASGVVVGDCIVATEKANLKSIHADGFVWMGHSSYFLQVDGVKFLVDPVFHSAAPLGFINKPLYELYTEDDIPEIDYLIITHDHYDHLEYRTMKALRNRVKLVICPLGVGAHLERWNFANNQIIELDWDDTFEDVLAEVHVHCLTQRHFAGRTFRRNSTLWASFMLQVHDRTVFVGGDGGYGTHFTEIGKRFPHIDLAILENGQYNPQWAHIHTMPYQLRQVIADLGVRRVVTVHHSRYKESIHPVDEPRKVAAYIAQVSSITVMMPLMGDCVSPFED